METLYRLSSDKNKLDRIFIHSRTYSINGKVYNKQDNFETRYDNYIKQGYKPIGELLKAMMKVGYTSYEKTNLIEYLSTQTLSDKDGVGLCMLATKYIPGKSKITFPRLAQPKLNGIRGVFGYRKITNPNDLFHTDIDEVYCKSRENNDYIMENIASFFLSFYRSNPQYQDIKFDGEFYIHGMSLNKIKAHIPMKNKQGTISKPEYNPDDMEFVIFDIINDDIQSIRSKELQRLRLVNVFLNKMDTLSITNNKIHILPYPDLISNEEDAILFRDECIANGYEGSILRDPNGLYQHGKRNATMFKHKKHKEKEFLIIDIKDEGYKNNMFIVKVTCQNDINNETFEVTIGSVNGVDKTQKWTNEDKESFVAKNPIGKMGTIAYYERSGVKKVPFHANLITVRDYE